MPFTIRIEQNGASFDDLRERYDRISRRLQRPDVTRSVKHVAEVWAMNYRSEGGHVGGWVDLAYRTVQDRSARGYGGAHPIMIRRGSLYAMSTLFFMQGREGNASASTNSSGQNVTTSASLSITGGAAVLRLSGPLVKHQFGNPGENLPARPYWFTNRAVVLGARLGVLEWIKDEVLT